MFFRMKQNKMAELVLLLLEPENRLLIPYAHELLQKAEKRYVRIEDQLEYVLQRLLGQMQLPVGNKNYYPGLLDNLNDSDYDSFCSALDYVTNYPDQSVPYTDLDVISQPGQFTSLKKWSDQVDVMGEMVEALVQKKDKATTLMAVRIQDECGISLQQRYGWIRETWHRDERLKALLHEPYERQGSILLRELRYLQYHLFHRPLEQGEEMPWYRGTGCRFYVQENVALPIVIFYLPSEMIEYGKMAELFLDGELPVLLVMRLDNVGIDDTCLTPTDYEDRMPNPCRVI